MFLLSIMRGGYMNILCEHSIDKSNGIEINLHCKKSNQTCAYYRWCVVDNCIKMIESWKNCFSGKEIN